MTATTTKLSPREAALARLTDKDETRYKNQRIRYQYVSGVGYRYTVKGGYEFETPGEALDWIDCARGDC